jgi:hypothetical protein
MRYSSSDSAGSWGTCYSCTSSYYSYQVRYTNMQEIGSDGALTLCLAPAVILFALHTAG